MILDFLTDNSGVVGLCFFFATFVGIAYWAFHPARKSAIEELRFIPLKEDE